MQQADDDVGRHVVSVIPPHALEIGDVGEVETAAEGRPRLQDGLDLARRPVEPKDTHGGIVQAIKDAGAGGEVIHLLSELKVARVEDGAEHPRGDAEVCEELVEGEEAVRRRDGGAQATEARGVGPEVAEGKDYAEGFLHAEDAEEGPFSVELDDGLVGDDAAGGYVVLAGVIAFGGTIPQEEASVESCRSRGRMSE